MTTQQVRIESALVDESGQHLVVTASLPNGQRINDALAPITYDRVQLATWLVANADRLRAMTMLTGIVEIDSQEYDRADAAHGEARRAAAAPTPDPTPAPVPDAPAASVDPASDTSAKKASK